MIRRIKCLIYGHETGFVPGAIDGWDYLVCTRCWAKGVMFRDLVLWWR